MKALPAQVLSAVVFVLLLSRFVVLSFHMIGSSRGRMSCTKLFMSEHDEVTDEEDDDVQEAYGNRSLEWTNKYRSVISYEKARQSVMDLGLRNKEDWDEYVADGKRYHGPYLPNHPDKMYKAEWISWDEFLGITRPFDETRDIVQNVLKIDNMNDYKAFVAADTKRARGLRIPAKPEIVYKKKGWISMEHFFGD